MRNLSIDVAGFRVRDRSKGTFDLYRSFGDSQNGVFWIWSPVDNSPMLLVASVGEGWEHVSVSRKNRCPNWPEMCQAKDAFFDEEDTVMQLHPPQSQYVNHMKFCLHLWKPMDGTPQIPIPDSVLVGPKSE